MNSTVTTGTFLNTRAVHALSPVGGSEHTLCGLAYDIGEHNMLDGFGEWVEHAQPRLISCDRCKIIIQYSRKLRLSTRTHSFSDALREVP